MALDEVRPARQRMVVGHERDGDAEPAKAARHCQRAVRAAKQHDAASGSLDVLSPKVMVIGSGCIDTTEAVPHRGRGARGQDRQQPFVLVVAVQR